MNTENQYTTTIDAGSTATHHESSPLNKQTFALKVQYNDDIRRFNIAGELVWESLHKRVAEAFKIPEGKLLLKYQDEEGDQVTISSTDDLFDAQRLAMQRSTLLRLMAFTAIRKKEAPVTTPSGATAPLLLHPVVSANIGTTPVNRSLSPAELKQQRKALKEQRKLLKEEKKQLHKQSKQEFRQRRREGRGRHRNNAEPFDPSKGTWLEQRQAMRDQRGPAEASGQHQQQGKSWRDLTHEERMARKSDWKEMPREERRALRQARREARPHREGGCRNKEVARFVKHVTVSDGTQLAPGQPFVKTWRMRNEGATAWPECKLIFVSKQNGDLMGAPEEVAASAAEPGKEVDISVNMIAPEKPGRYVGFWRLSALDGRKFGQRIWIKIDVTSPTTPSSSISPETPFDLLEEEISQSFVENKDGREDPLVVPMSMVAPQQQEPSIAELLKQLKNLGFSENVGRNILLLKKHNGDLTKVIAELIE